MSDWVDIGEQLRIARERRGKTILDVEHVTKIPASVLKRLEENDYSRFASPVYSKSFLTQYSAYLDVDAADWINALRSETVITKQETIEFFRDHSEFERPGFHLWDNKSKKQKNHQASPLAPVIGMIITGAVVFAGYQHYKDLENEYGNNNEANVTSEQTIDALKTQETKIPVDNAATENSKLSKKTASVDTVKDSL